MTERNRLASATLGAVALAIAAPAAARAAAPAATCHCFTNRTFDPAQPSAADPYILATSRSSLLSAAFATPKAGLVQEVMSGADPDDLWVAWWAGARIGRDAGDLLQARASRGSWKAAIGEPPAAALPPAFRTLLARGAPSRDLAAFAVDDVLVTRLAARPADLAALRGAGASSPETILSTLLAPRLRITPAEVLKRQRGGKVSWGMLLDEARLKPKEIDGAVRQAMR